MQINNKTTTSPNAHKLALNAAFVAVALTLSLAPLSAKTKNVKEIKLKTINTAKVTSTPPLLTLIDPKSYLSLSYTDLTMHMPNPEFQNTAENLGSLGLFGQDVMALLCAPPDLYRLFKNKETDNCLTATGLIDGKSCHTCIVSFEQKISDVQTLLKEAKGGNDYSEIKLIKGKPGNFKYYLKWPGAGPGNTSGDWYMAVFGGKNIIISSSETALAQTFKCFTQKNKVLPQIYTQHVNKLAKGATHFQIDEITPDGEPPVIIEMKTPDGDMIIEMMGDTSGSTNSDVKQHFEKMRKGLESEIEGKLADGPLPHTLKLSGGKLSETKKQGAIMSELSPYFAHHFWLLKDQEVSKAEGK